MLMILTFGSYFIGVFLVVALAISRIRSLNGAQTGRLTGAAIALGGRGEITRDGGRITLTNPDRVFSLSGTDYGKRQPQTFHLGTTIRSGVRTAPVGSAFRDADRPQVLPRLPHVVVRKEGALAGLTRALRLNREIETGDRAFDDAAYVEHEGDRALVAQLLADARLRAAIVAGLDAGAAVVFNEEEHGVALRFAGGTEPGDPSVLSAAGQKLGAIADLVPAFEDATLRGRPSRWRQGLAAAGPIFVAGPGLVLGGFAHQRFGPIDRGFAVSALAAIAVAIAVALATGWTLARGRVGALRRFYIAMTLAVSLLPALIGSGLAIANGAGVDTREKRTTRVLSTYSSTRKGGTSCRAKLEPWGDMLGKVEAGISCKRMETIKAGDAATVTVGVGRLGWEWIENAAVP